MDLLHLTLKHRRVAKKEPFALLRGAAACAQGLLYRLDVSSLGRLPVNVLLELLAANAGSLREPCLHSVSVLGVRPDGRGALAV